MLTRHSSLAVKSGDYAGEALWWANNKVVITE